MKIIYLKSLLIGYIILAFNQKLVAQCTATITPVGTPTGCGNRVLNATPIGDVWTQKASMLQNRSHAAGFSIGNKGYLGTGTTLSNTYNNDFWEYDATLNSWTQKANFPGTARLAAVGFAVGSKGYIGSGVDLNNLRRNDFYEYDPSNNTWTQRASITGSRSYAVGFSIGTKAYVGTGYVSTNYVNDFWEFDPAINTWTAKANFPGTGRHSATAFSIGTKGYLGFGSIGTAGTGDFWEYSPATNSWVQKAGIYGMQMFAASGFALGGKGFMVGGKDQGTTNAFSTQTYQYDPVTNLWRLVATHNANSKNYGVAFTIGGKGYYATGSTGNSTNFATNVLYEYEPKANYLWSNNATTQSISVVGTNTYSVLITTASGCTASATQTIATSPNPTITTSGASLVCSATNNTILASGALTYTWSANAGGVLGPQAVVAPTVSTTYTVSGTSGSCTVNHPVPILISGWPSANISVSGPTIGCGVRTLSVNPGGNTWTQKANMTIGRERAIAFSLGSKGYIGTGTQGGAFGAKDFWEYDPVFDTWTQKADFGGGSRYHAYYFSIDGKGYAGGGYSTLGLYGFAMDFWEYDPATNVWTRKGDVPMTPRSAAVSLVIGNKGYMGGGQDNYGNFAFKDFWEYNPLTDNWTQKTDIPSIGRGGPAAFGIGNKGYLGLGYPAYPSTVVLNDFYEYSPITNTWTAVANFPGGGNANGVGFTIGNKGYVTNGNYNANQSALWEYNPSNNSWTARTDFPGGARPWPVAFVVGSKAYVGTGPIGSTLVDYKDLWEYEPAPSILWSNGASTQSITALSSGSYSVTINSVTGCSVASAQTLSLSPSPTLVITGNPNFICTGSNATLNVSGASSYTWSNNAGGGNSTSVIVTPTTSTSYSISATSGTCSVVEPISLYTLPVPPSSMAVSGPTQTCGTLTLSLNAPPMGWIQKSSMNGVRRQAVSFSIGTKGYVGLGQSNSTTLNDFWEYDSQTDTWSQKASYPAGPRYDAAAFSVNSKGYVTCGYDNTSTPKNDLWEYNPITNSWIQKLSLTTARAGATAFGLNGKGYVGLGDGVSTKLKDFWEYDPNNNSWIQKTDFGGGQRSYAASFVIGSKAYVGTGYSTISTTSDFWEFDPIPNTWTSKAAYGGGALYNSRGFAINNKGYFVAGDPLNNAFWEYNPSLNTWTQKPSLTGSARTEHVAFAIGNKGYVATGLNVNTNPNVYGDLWEFDPGSTTVWSTGATLQAIQAISSGNYSVLINNSYGCSASIAQSVALSPNPTITVSGIPTILCSGLTSTLVANGANSYTWSGNAGSVNSGSVSVSPTINTTYTVSGTSGICTVDVPISILVSNTPTASIAVSAPTLGCGSVNLSVSSPSSNWTQKANLSVARSQALAISIGNKGYLGLGLSSTGSNLNDFWEYDPNLNTWTQKANFSGGGRGNAAGFSISNKGYVSCGFVTSGGQYRNDLWQYDPIGNTWVQKASLPAIARHYCVGFAINGKGYVGLGTTALYNLNDLWEYDPVFDSWLQKANYGGGIRTRATCFVIGNQAYVGNGVSNTTVLNDMWAYNPITNTWLAKASYPGTPVQLATGFSIGSKGYVGLGTTGVNDLNNFWEYNSVSNTWVQLANFPGAARQLAAAFSFVDKAYVATGYNSFNAPNYKNDVWEFMQVNTINWSTGSTLQTISTATSGNYSVTITNIDGCSASAVQSLSLSPNPTVAVSIQSSLACAGNSQTLTASGAGSYTWSANAGAVNTPSVIVTPSLPTLYTVSATNGTCTVNYPVYVDFIITPDATIIPIGSTTLCSSAVTLSSNPVTSNVWTQKSSVTNARSFPVAFSVNGKGYLGTGLSGTTAFNDFWEYDPTLNTWTQKANFAGGQRYAAVGISIGNKGYIGTGFDMTAGVNKNDFWEYDPVTNNWTQKANVSTFLRRQAAGFTIGNKGYIGTGWDGASHRNDFWEYDPSLNIWTQKANITGPRYGAVGVSQGNKGYIGGGQVLSGSGNEFWEYNPILNSWTAKANIGGTTTRVGAVGFTIGNRIIITGGSTATDTWEYNPATDTWISRATFSGPYRSNAAAFAINGKGYVACGSGSTNYNDLREYSPFTDVLWSTSATTSTISVATTGTYSLVITNLAGCTTNATQAVSITPMPTVTINGLNSICNGDNLALIANGANSYTWSASAGNVTTNSITITPSVNTTYTVAGEANGCIATAVKNVTVNAIPLVTANTSSTLICQGFNVTLNGGGASTYTWTGGVVNNQPFAPIATGDYTVIGTSIGNCTNTAIVSISVNPSPTLSVNSGSICAGNTFTINPSGALSYMFSSGTNIVSPNTSSSYSVTGSNSLGCTNAVPAISNVSVFTLPIINASNGIVCAGNAYTINPTGAVSYTFTSGSNVVSPANTTTYGITCTSSAGCLSLNQTIITVSVESLPIVSVNSGTICDGFSFNLNPTGASTYSYSSGGSAIVSPSATSVYSVTGISPFGCLSSIPATATIQVVISPTVSVNSGSICEGQSFTMAPTGAISYTYSSGVNIVSPSSTSVYSVTGINAFGCTNAIPALATVTVFNLPNIIANSASICSGDSFTINPSGASSYTFSSGSNIVSPAFTSTYSVLGSSSVGCISPSAAIVTVTVNPLPSLTISSGTICDGSVFNLGPNGATTYTILPGGSSTVSPNITTTYSVVGTNSFGCVSQAPVLATITVYSLPIVAVNSGTICAGSVFTLVPNGATSYTFSGGSSTVNPNTTTSYSVIGSDVNGCVSNVTTALVTVYQLPIIGANNATICSGQSHTILPTGASTYSFSSGSNVVSPLSSTVYTISGTSAQGCIGNTALVTISVQPGLTLNISGTTTVCEGKTLILTATGATTYSWNTGTLGSSITATPLTSTVYIVNASSGVCTASASQAISLIPSPSLSVMQAIPDLCVGNTTTITANGADQYNWSDGSTAPLIVVTPSETTTYTFTGTNLNGCSNLLIVTQLVSLCTDISEKLLTHTGILLYPNPASQQFYIIANQETVAELYTINGQLVQVLNLNQGTNNIDIKGLSAGMYFVRVQQTQNNVIQKFIIQQ